MFTTITFAEMSDLLKAEKGWTISEQYAHEYVFEYAVPFWPGVVVKVFTSVNRHNNNSRGYAGDAIRVVAVDTVQNRGIRKMPHVKRTQNWRQNLKDRVVDCLKSLFDDPKRK